MTTPTNPPADETTAPSEARRTRLDVPSPAPALTLADLDAIEARMRGDQCGHEISDRDGRPAPCGRAASGWRWYQDVEHEPLLAPACGVHENEGGNLMASLVAALRQAWRSRDTWARVEAETRAEMHTRLAEHRDAVEVLKLRLSEVTGERDRARSVAVALEGELERLRVGIEVRIAGWSSYRTDPASLTAASCAEALRRLLAPPDAQEGTQEARTAAAGVGVPDEGCEAVSAFYERLPGRHVHHYGQGTHDLGGTECECGPTVVEVPTQDGAE